MYSGKSVSLCKYLYGISTWTENKFYLADPLLTLRILSLEYLPVPLSRLSRLLVYHFHFSISSLHPQLSFIPLPPRHAFSSLSRDSPLKFLRYHSAVLTSPRTLLARSVGRYVFPVSIFSLTPLCSPRLYTHTDTQTQRRRYRSFGFFCSSASAPWLRAAYVLLCTVFRQRPYFSHFAALFRSALKLLSLRVSLARRLSIAIWNSFSALKDGGCAPTRVCALRLGGARARCETMR